MAPPSWIKSNTMIPLAEPVKEEPDVVYVEAIEAPVEPPPPPPPTKKFKTYTFKTTTPKDTPEVSLTTPKPLSGNLVYQSEPSEPVVKVFKFEPHDAKPNKYKPYYKPSTAPAKQREEPAPAELLEEPYYFSVPTTETIYNGQEIFPEDITNALSEFDAVVASDGMLLDFKSKRTMWSINDEKPETHSGNPLQHQFIWAIIPQAHRIGCKKTLRSLFLASLWLHIID